MVTYTEIMYLRDGSAKTILCATTLRQKSKNPDWIPACLTQLRRNHSLAVDLGLIPAFAGGLFHGAVIPVFVCFVACLTSQQQASVSQGQVCSDNFTCCHTEIEVADPTFYLTQSQYTDTGPTSPSADPVTPGAWQVATGVPIFKSLVWLDPEKIPAQAGFEPRTFRSRGGCSYQWLEIPASAVGLFHGPVIPVTWNSALQWLPYQVPGVIGPVLGLVGTVSVYWSWVRVWTATSISVWQHVQLSEQIHPWDPLVCCWDVTYPTNNNT